MLYNLHINDSLLIKKYMEAMKSEPRVTLYRGSIYVDSDKDWDTMRKACPDCVVALVRSHELHARFARRPITG